MNDDDILTADSEGTDLKPTLRLGTINGVSSTGVTVQWAGDESASTKEYKVFTAYYPIVGDSIAALPTSGTYLVLGTFGTPNQKVSFIPESEKGAAGGVATLDASGNVVQKANNAANADNATHAATVDKATYASELQSETHFYVNDLSSSATTAQIVSVVNEIINAGEHFGFLN